MKAGDLVRTSVCANPPNKVGLILEVYALWCPAKGAYETMLILVGDDRYITKSHFLHSLGTEAR